MASDMMLIFSQDEVYAIMRKHVADSMGVPDAAITGVGWTYEEHDGKQRLTVQVAVKTEHGSPYRAPC
jgi:hypothetical protein